MSVEVVAGTTCLVIVVFQAATTTTAQQTKCMDGECVSHYNRTIFPWRCSRDTFPVLCPGVWPFLRATGSQHLNSLHLAVEVLQACGL